MSQQNSTESHLAAAFRIAISAHADQVDKLGVPYIEHVKAVAQAVAPLGFEYQIVGLLHDSLEDCDDRSIVSMELLRNLFGPKVATAIDAITKRADENYEKNYLPRVMSNPIAAEVKRADVAHNRSRLHLLKPEVRKKLLDKYDRFDALYGDKNYSDHPEQS